VIELVLGGGVAAVLVWYVLQPLFRPDDREPPPA
jgi:hypothetical protein